MPPERLAAGITPDFAAKPSLPSVTADSAGEAGLLVGRTNLPVVNEADGLFHVAKIRPDDAPVETIDRLSGQLEEDPLFDEDEII